MLRKLYHGSINVVEEPSFGLGNKNNDYGFGFIYSKKYSSSDEYLYKAPFQKIYALINVFDVDPSIFVE